MSRSETRMNTGPIKHLTIRSRSNAIVPSRARSHMAITSISHHVPRTLPGMETVDVLDALIDESFMIHIGHVQLREMT